MKSAINSPNYCLPDSPIHSAIFILIKKTSIRGGLTDSKREKKNAGWRIDYFLASASLNEKLCSAKIHTEIFGSDHCPVELEVDL